MTTLLKNREIRAVIDTQIFIPALTGRESEAQFYFTAFRKCWKFVFTDDITAEYRRVMHKFGFPADIIFVEVTRLTLFNKYRYCEVDQNGVTEDLSPRKDRHIIAPCLSKHANVIVTDDGGILERKKVISQVTGALVLSLGEAQAALRGLPDC